MPHSPLYSTQIPVILTYTAPRVPAKNPDGTAKYDANNQRVYEPGSGLPAAIEVHLTPEASGLVGERPGLDTTGVRYKGQVVKTPVGAPLELPAGITEFDLSVGGTPGKLRIRPVVVDQHATERRVLGQEFRAVWEA